jgi:hypothetical protein
MAPHRHNTTWYESHDRTTNRLCSSADIEFCKSNRKHHYLSKLLLEAYWKFHRFSFTYEKLNKSKPGVPYAPALAGQPTAGLAPPEASPVW